MVTSSRFKEPATFPLTGLQRKLIYLKIINEICLCSVYKYEYIYYKWLLPIDGQMKTSLIFFYLKLYFRVLIGLHKLGK